MEFSTCNICGCDKYQEICDIAISPTLAQSKLVKCRKCGFYYANPRLERALEEEHYKNRYHENEPITYWHKQRASFFKRALKEITKFRSSGDLLDIGCGTGYFMDLARSKRWSVKGIDLSDEAIKYAKENFSLDVTKGDFLDINFEKESFDVVTMWNVLDQVNDPKTVLESVNNILKKGGYIFMRLSNLNFHLMLRKFTGKQTQKNPGLTPYVFHLYSFNKKSIRRLLDITGFLEIMVKADLLEEGNIQLVRIFGKNIALVISVIANLITMAIYFLSFGRIIISSSIVVIACKS
ncbi:MAG: class I SAM-dependent methyltransferase [Candidatus Omnitrophota bacterium]